MHSILVKDYMNQDPHAVSNTDTVRGAVDILMKAHISGAPVVDAANNLVGFVSEQDCIATMLNDTFHCEESPCVTKVMTTDIKSVTPQTSIVELAERMVKAPPKNYPVCESGKLVGVISRRLILKALLENSDDCYLHV